MRRRAIAAAAVPAVLALGAYQADRYLWRKLAPARREMPHEPIEVGLDAEEVWIRNPAGIPLHAWYAAPASVSAPTVVVQHGWGANASLMLPIAALLAEAGFGVTVGDARGHGHSAAADQVSLPRFRDDLGAFVDFTHAQPESGQVAVLGHSMGASAALLVSSSRSDLAATVAVGAFADPREIMERAPGLQRLPGGLRRGVFRRMELAMGERFEEIAPIGAVDDVESPLLLVHGGDDPIIPREDFERLGAAAPPGSRSLLVEGGVHDRLDEYLPHVPEIIEFLSAACRTPAGHR